MDTNETFDRLKIKLNTLQFSHDSASDSPHQTQKCLLFPKRRWFFFFIENWNRKFTHESVAKRKWRKGNWRLNISHHHYRFHVLFLSPQLISPPSFASKHILVNRFRWKIGRETCGGEKMKFEATLQFPASHQILIIVDSVHREINCLGDLRTRD